jgi:hypothetical protein
MLMIMFIDQDVSNAVLQVFDVASRTKGLEFDERDIDAGVEELNATNDEDMLVAICYIAGSLTFGRKVELEEINF